MNGLTIEHDAVPGRLRLRAEGLRGNRARCAVLGDMLRAMPGVTAGEVRSLTGSILLRFDPGEGHAAMRLRVARLLETARATGRSGAGASGAGSQDGRDGTHPAWHALAAEVALQRLGASPERGLSTAEAARRLARFGPNTLPRQAPPAPLALLAKQVASLPVLMLAGSATVSLCTGGVADAAATLAVVAVNAVLGYVTEAEAERTIHALMDTSTQAAEAIRDGAPCRVAARELVPGDLLVVRAGTAVPADARLISARRLRVDEAALTGESVPADKCACRIAEADAPIGARPGMLHAGTLISEGSGRAVVVATGGRTEAAAIQRLSQGGARPVAPIEAELDALGTGLAKASIAACAVFVGVGLARGYPLGAMLKDALALAVAAVPEGLPMVATTTLSLGLRRMERKGILIRELKVVESMGALQTLCLDKTGTLTENRMTVVAAVAGLSEVDPGDRAALAPLAEIAALNTEAAGGAASPTEAALLDFAAGLGADRAALVRSHPRERLIERTRDRPWVTTLHGGTRPMVAVKGAPEALLERCATIRDAGQTRPITGADRDRILTLNDALAARPARVLGLARRDGPPGEGEADRALTFLGLVAMSDPIRPGAKPFVRALHRAGIETVLITGDQAATATAVARDLDLSQGAPLRIVDSAEIGALDPGLLAGLVRGAHVFSRVSSHQKLAVVQALQATGRVVAMTGDGVNDGPALNAADVGIAMGASGTNLAREVANVVITDDELPTLIAAIEQGRALYRNIRRALEFLITTNMSEIAVSLVEAAEGPGALETPMELLWINLVTDVMPGLGLALADPDEDMMQRPPRDAQESVIPARDMRRMGLDSAAIAGAALAAHFSGTLRHGSGPETRGMTFLTLSLGQLLYTLVCQRSDPRRLRPDRLFENRTLDFALAASAGLAVAPYFLPGLGRLLGVAPLGARDAALSLGLAALPVGVVLARRGVAIERRTLTAAETP